MKKQSKKFPRPHHYYALPKTATDFDYWLHNERISRAEIAEHLGVTVEKIEYWIKSEFRVISEPSGCCQLVRIQQTFLEQQLERY